MSMKKIGREVLFMHVNDEFSRNGEGAFIRLKNGDFDIKDSIELYKFLKLDFEEMKKHVISIEDYYMDMKKIDLNKEEYAKFLNGVKLSVDEPDKLVKVCVNGKYKGLGKVEEKKLKRYIIEK